MDSPPNDDGNAGIPVESGVWRFQSELGRLAERLLVDWNEETGSVSGGPSVETPAVIREGLATNEGGLPPREVDA